MEPELKLAIDTYIASGDKKVPLRLIATYEQRQLIRRHVASFTGYKLIVRTCYGPKVISRLCVHCDEYDEKFKENLHSDNCAYGDWWFYCSKCSNCNYFDNDYREIPEELREKKIKAIWKPCNPGYCGKKAEILVMVPGTPYKTQGLYTYRKWGRDGVENK